jgi:hypothetical protein
MSILDALDLSHAEPPAIAWNERHVLSVCGRSVSFRTDIVGGLVLLGAAMPDDEPETDERAVRRVAVLEQWVDATGEFHDADLPLLMCSLLEAHMVVGKLPHPTVTLAGHLARSETVEMVATALYRHASRRGVRLATTTRPMRCVGGAEVHGFVWTVPGWIILQAGALPPSTSGRHAQLEIPVVEAFG